MGRESNVPIEFFSTTTYVDREKMSHKNSIYTRFIYWPGFFFPMRTQTPSFPLALLVHPLKVHSFTFNLLLNIILLGGTSKNNLFVAAAATSFPLACFFAMHGVPGVGFF